jgi:hypothetical protein
MSIPEVLRRTNRNYSGRIDIVVREVVVTFDVIEVHRIRNAANLIEIPQIPVQVRVISDPADIAFEMAMVDRVEANQRHEEPPVRFKRQIAKEVSPVRQHFFQLIERFKEQIGSLFVGTLSGGKPRAIDPVVDVFVDQLVESIDCGSMLCRVKIQARLGQGIEFAVQDSQEIVIGIIDNPSRSRVPKHRHGDAALVRWICGKVGFRKKIKPIHGIFRVAGSLSKSPASIITNRIDHCHPDHVLKPLQVADDNRPVRPWTGPGNIQMVPSRFRRELRLTVRSDPCPKGVLLPHKVPRFGLLVGELSFRNSFHESDISARRQKCEYLLGLVHGLIGSWHMAAGQLTVFQDRSLFMFDHGVTIPP